MILKKKNKTVNDNLKKPIYPFFILLAIIIIGTIGYDFIWRDTDSTLLDAFYMTIITITTVGYSEIYTLDTTGRLFTTFVAVFGIGSLFYILGILMENLVFLQISNYRGQKRIMKQLEDIQGHIIIVGLGRVGKLTAKELSGRNQDFVIIDNKIDENDTEVQSIEAIIIEGDATEDETLKRAGIERAKGMIVATANSATTVFVVISAKVLNPDIFIIARADEESSRVKLLRTGADRVVNPYAIGGQRLANLMVNRNIVEFFETGISSKEGSLNIESIELPNECSLIGKTIREADLRRKTGVTILAVIRDGEPNVNPDGEFKLADADTLMAFGTRDDLNKLEKLISNKE